MPVRAFLTISEIAKNVEDIPFETRLHAACERCFLPRSFLRAAVPHVFDEPTPIVVHVQGGWIHGVEHPKLVLRPGRRHIGPLRVRLLRRRIRIAVGHERDEDDVSFITLEVRRIADSQTSLYELLLTDLLDQHVSNNTALLAAHHRHDAKRHTVVTLIAAAGRHLFDDRFGFHQIDGVVASFFDFRAFDTAEPQRRTYLRMRLLTQRENLIVVESVRIIDDFRYATEMLPKHDGRGEGSVRHRIEGIPHVQQRLVREIGNVLFLDSVDCVQPLERSAGGSLLVVTDDDGLIRQGEHTDGENVALRGFIHDDHVERMRYQRIEILQYLVQRHDPHGHRIHRLRQFAPCRRQIPQRVLTGSLAVFPHRLEPNIQGSAVIGILHFFEMQTGRPADELQHRLVQFRVQGEGLVQQASHVSALHDVAHPCVRLSQRPRTRIVPCFSGRCAFGLKNIRRPLRRRL